MNALRHAENVNHQGGADVEGVQEEQRLRSFTKQAPLLKQTGTAALVIYPVLERQRSS
jgi:hypothetical protein